MSSHFELAVTKDGAEGCLKAKELIPDLIVSDVMMPSKDGYQVCAELKQDQLTAHIPIILLTAKSSVESKIEGWTTGADAYLTKPFHSEELIIRIEKLIEGRIRLHTWLIEHSMSRIIKNNNEILNPVDQIFVKQLVDHISENISDVTYSVEQLANSIYMSRSQLFRKL